MSLTFREITFQCANPECGHTYVVNMEFARTLSPSAVPNLALQLPLSPHVRERRPRNSSCRSDALTLVPAFPRIVPERREGSPCH